MAAPMKIFVRNFSFVKKALYPNQTCSSRFNKCFQGYGDFVRKDVSVAPFLCHRSLCTAAGGPNTGEVTRGVDTTAVKQLVYFDTHGMVKAFQDKGFSAEQSEQVTYSLMESVQTIMEFQNKTMVSKAQQEVMFQQIMGQISGVKKDMVILEKSEFSALRSETEKLEQELVAMRQNFKDEITKMKSHVKLDLNLERSRAHEELSTSEKRVSQLDHRIETEVANLRTLFERYRNDVYKFAAGTVVSCLTLLLGFFRLFS